jgi:hypothetical protein
MLVIFCADMLESTVKNFMDGESIFHGKLERKLQDKGYSVTFSAQLAALYLSLKDTRDFYTHRGFDKFEKLRLERVNKTSFKLDSTRATSIDDINFVRKVYYSSFYVFSGVAQSHEFSLDPITPPFYEDLKVKEETYDLGSCFSLMRHNLQICFEHWDEGALGEKADTVLFSINNAIRFYKEAFGVDLNKLFLFEILDKTRVVEYIDLSRSERIEIASKYFEVLSEEEKKH